MESNKTNPDPAKNSKAQTTYTQNSHNQIRHKVHVHICKVLIYRGSIFRPYGRYLIQPIKQALTVQCVKGSDIHEQV